MTSSSQFISEFKGRALGNIILAEGAIRFFHDALLDQECKTIVVELLDKAISECSWAGKNEASSLCHKARSLILNNKFSLANELLEKVEIELR